MSQWLYFLIKHESYFIYSFRQQTDWDVNLSGIVYAINTRTQASTRFTPYHVSTYLFYRIYAYRTGIYLLYLQITGKNFNKYCIKNVITKIIH